MPNDIPEKDAWDIYMRYEQGYSFEEIAEEDGLETSEVEQAVEEILSDPTDVDLLEIIRSGTVFGAPQEQGEEAREQAKELICRIVYAFQRRGDNERFRRDKPYAERQEILTLFENTTYSERTFDNLLNELLESNRLENHEDTNGRFILGPAEEKVPSFPNIQRFLRGIGSKDRAIAEFEWMKKFLLNPNFPNTEDTEVTDASEIYSEFRKLLQLLQELEESASRGYPKAEVDDKLKEIAERADKWGFVETHREGRFSIAEDGRLLLEGFRSIFHD